MNCHPNLTYSIQLYTFGSSGIYEGDTPLFLHPPLLSLEVYSLILLTKCIVLFFLSKFSYLNLNNFLIILSPLKSLLLPRKDRHPQSCIFPFILLATRASLLSLSPYPIMFSSSPPPLPPTQVLSFL